MVNTYAKRLALLLLLGAAVPVAQAQKNFRPGYVVRPAGDTLRGEIDLRGGQRMANLCLFRPAPGAEATPYAPADLKSFGLRGGARYDACQLPPAPSTGAAPNAPAALFLQVLAQGKAALYTFTDENSRARYFLRPSGGPLAELIQTTQTVYRTDDTPVQERTFPFRQVLRQAFGDCAQVLPLVANAELSDSQLTDLVNRYNSCSGPGVVPMPTAPVLARATKTQVGLVVGVQQASAMLNDGGETTVRSGWRPVAGVGLLLSPASFNTRLTVRLEALYQTQQLESEYQRNHGTTTTLRSTRNAAIRLNTVRVPLMFRYTWPAGRVRPYLQAGAEVAVLLNFHQAVITERYQELNGSYSTDVRQIEMRGLGIGPVAGVGVFVPAGAAGSFYVEGRFSQLDSASQAASILSGPVTVSVLLGYCLGH